LLGQLNAKQLELARCICLSRDGYCCIKCKTSLTDLSSVAQIDHIDNNNKNNPLDGSNWQLLCGSCNVRKSWIEKRIEVIENKENTPFAYAVSSKMELNYVKWLIDELMQGHDITWDKAINTGALEIDGSPVTTKKYIRKHTEDPKHPKAIFKTWLGSDYQTYIKFSDQAAKYFNV